MYSSDGEWQEIDMRQGNRLSSGYAALDVESPGSMLRPDSPTAQGTWSPSSLYHDSSSTRRGPPPSSYPFSDPLSRRSSLESDSHRNSSASLAPPTAPFMSQIKPHHTGGSQASSFRAPFQSPSSRAVSSLWSPPSYANLNNALSAPNALGMSSPNPSMRSLAMLGPKVPLPSTRLATKLEKADKPWMAERDRRATVGHWLTFLFMFAGIAGAAALCYTGFAGVPVMKDSQLCLVMSDDFDSLDSNNWQQDIQLGGFGNGEFQMTTGAQANIYTSNSQLYIVPTLTSNSISGGYNALFDGANYTLSGCTSTNTSACSASSSANTGSVINPVMSARINTKGKQYMQYGRVEIRAKLPTGDWLWPAVWMLPENDTYGAWPMSGEIDIMEARGNGPAYPAQGNNFVRSSLNYGPIPSLVHTIFGWWSTKRTTFAADFHVYTLEWTDSWMRFYTDNRLQKMLDLRMNKKSFWDQAGFPQTAQNGSTKVVIEDIYTAAGGGNAAPFDQQFYMIIDLAVGGTSGWFPDSVGGKMWYDASATAMHDFAKAQSNWSSTWPQNVDDLAFRIDYVKMWKLC